MEVQVPVGLTTVQADAARRWGEANTLDPHLSGPSPAAAVGAVDDLDDDALDRLVARTTVYGRVAPVREPPMSAAARRRCSVRGMFRRSPTAATGAGSR